MLGFTAAAALSTTLLVGLMPALQAIQTDLIPSLKNTPAIRFRTWGARDFIVTGQIALSVILVICSVLVVRSLQHALTLNLGFDPANAIVIGDRSTDVELGRRMDLADDPGKVLPDQTVMV